MSDMVQLSNEFVSKIKKEQLENLKKQGTVIEKNGDYYLNSTFTVSDGGIDSSSDGKGVTVESSQANVVSRTELTIIDINTILDEVKDAGIDLTDEDAASVKKKIAEAGIAIDNNGNITLESDEIKTKLENILNQFLIINKQKTIEFTEDSDKEFIKKLVMADIIKLNDDQATYTILDADKLAEKLSDQSEEQPQSQSVNLNIEGSKKTVTVTEENKVNVPENIKTLKRSEKKQFEKDMKQGVTNFADHDENAEWVTFAVIQEYGQEDMARNKKALIKDNDLKRTEDVIDYYLENYALDSEQALFDTLLRKESEEISDEELLAFYKEARRQEGLRDDNATFEGEDGKIKKEKAKKLYAASKMKGWSKDTLLNRMTYTETKKELKENGKIEKYKEKWIKAETKDQIRTAETRQNIANTSTYFSKEQAKAARKAETDKTKIHQDIGDAGRKLVTACPDTFCERVTEDQSDFSVKINGEDVYFKFSQEKWDKWCSDQVNRMDKEGYGKDEHGTLNELRDTWLTDVSLTTADGKTRSLEEIIGNGNGKVGNGELNKIRHMIETSGRSVDANNTAWKRLGNVLKNAAVAYGLGFLTAGVGSLAAGAVSVTSTAYAFAEATATATATATAEATATATATATASVEGGTYYAYSDPQTHDVTVYYFENGALVDKTTYTITDEAQLVSIDVPGQTATDTQTVTATDTQTDTDTDTQTDTASKKPNRLKIAHNAGLMAAFLSLPRSFATMGKVHAKGTGAGKDAVIADLTIQRTEESEAETTTLNLNLQAKQTVYIKSGKIEKTEQEQIKTTECKLHRRKNKNNQWETQTLSNMICDKYNVKYNSSEYKAILKYVRDINNCKSREIPAGDVWTLPNEIPDKICTGNIKINNNDVSYSPVDPNAEGNIRAGGKKRIPYEQTSRELKATGKVY